MRCSRKGHLSIAAVQFLPFLEAEKAEAETSCFFWRSESRLADSLSGIVPQIAVSPTKAWDVIADPLSQVGAIRACPEGAWVAIPDAENIFVFFAYADVICTLVTPVRLSRLDGAGAVNRRWLIIAVAIGAHRASPELVPVPASWEEQRTGTGFAEASSAVKSAVVFAPGEGLGLDDWKS